MRVLLNFCASIRQEDSPSPPSLAARINVAFWKLSQRRTFQSFQLATKQMSGNWESSPNRDSSASSADAEEADNKEWKIKTYCRYWLTAKRWLFVMKTARRPIRPIVATPTTALIRRYVWVRKTFCNIFVVFLLSCPVVVLLISVVSSQFCFHLQFSAWSLTFTSRLWPWADVAVKSEEVFTDVLHTKP